MSPVICGCSTLLNVMFGTQLRSGQGRVTRGVHLQLVPCPGRKDYEYLLLLDTEGLRSGTCLHIHMHISSPKARYVGSSVSARCKLSLFPDLDPCYNLLVSHSFHVNCHQTDQYALPCKGKAYFGFRA